MDIFIDMDSTMNDFASGYINFYNRIYGTNLVFKRNQLVQYEIAKCIPGLNENDAIAVREKIFGMPEFWQELPIYPGVYDTVKWITENFNTYILTAPWIPFKGCAKEKYNWVEKYLPFFPLDKIIFCHDKYLVHSDSLLIDDHVRHLNTFKGKTLKINYPYNSMADTDYQANDWYEVLNIMKEIKQYDQAM